MLRKLLATLAVVSVLASFAVFGSFAIFTDSQSVGSNTFSTGTVGISTEPAKELVTFEDMAPGDQVTNPIKVSNDGSLELRYAVTSTTTENTLAGELDLTVKTEVKECTNEGFDKDGTVIYGPGDLGSEKGINVIGDPAQGEQKEDRTLKPGEGEELCFSVQLPSSTGNSYQGLSTTATFSFEAEQTANNP